jgi:hypothetical protein
VLRGMESDWEPAWGGDVLIASGWAMERRRGRRHPVLERRGDMLIAFGRGFADGDVDVASPSVSGVAMSSSPLGRVLGTATWTSPPRSRGAGPDFPGSVQVPAAASARRCSMVLRKTEVSKGLASTSDAPRVLAISRYSPAGTRPPPEMAITGSFGSVRRR